MQDTLARRLRLLRAERGWTLREAAPKLGVTPGTLSELERDVRHPQDVTLSRIAKGYGVPVDELLGEPVPLDEAPEAGRSEAQAPEETPQEISLLNGPRIVDWLLEHGLTVGAVDDETFMNYVLDLDLEEVDEEGRPVAVMELGRALGYQRDKARDLLWMRPSKYRSLEGLLPVDPNAPVAEQKKQRRDKLSKLRMDLDRRYRRRVYALKRYAEFLAELLAEQKKSAPVSSIGEMRRRADMCEEKWSQFQDQARKAVA